MDQKIIKSHKSVADRGQDHNRATSHSSVYRDDGNQRRGWCGQ